MEAINLAIPKELKAKVDKLAKKKCISRNALIRLAIVEMIEKEK